MMPHHRQICQSSLNIGIASVAGTRHGPRYRRAFTTTAPRLALHSNLTQNRFVFDPRILGEQKGFAQDQ